MKKLKFKEKGCKARVLDLSAVSRTDSQSVFTDENRSEPSGQNRKHKTYWFFSLLNKKNQTDLISFVRISSVLVGLPTVSTKS